MFFLNWIFIGNRFCVTQVGLIVLCVCALLWNDLNRESVQSEPNTEICIKCFCYRSQCGVRAFVILH